MIKEMRRRLLAIGLSLTMVVSLCACGGATKQKETEKTEEITSVVENDSSEDNNNVESQEATETTKVLESTGETETTSVTSEQTTTVKPSETEVQTTTKKPEKTTKKPQQTTKKPEQTTAKPNKPTNDSNHPSNVNEKLTWTNAGWANEYNKTASGNYVYATNKKQTIDAAKGNGFSMTVKDFTLDEWGAMELDGYVKGNPGRIRWTSEDPSVAQVIDNELVGIYAGKTKISGTCGNTTVHINVTVKRGYQSTDISLNSMIVNLYPNESFQLIATERGAVYKSKDTSIAKVSSTGVVTGVKPGKTIVTATYNGVSRECHVYVSENNGSYLNVSLDTKYTITKERVLLATDKAFILLDAGVVIEDKLLENVEAILNKIENVTGYSFSGNNSKVSDRFITDRILISVNGNGLAYGGAGGVTIAPYDITVQECGAHVLVHELLHTIQQRNSVHCGNALVEGFAEYFGMKIYNDLPFSKNMYDENYNSWMNMYVSFSNITFTADNIEQYLLHGPDAHPTSYFFVSYLAKKYGDKKIYELLSAITDEFVKRYSFASAGEFKNEFTEEDIFAVIKSKTSSNVAKEFLTYFNGLEQQWQAMRFDLSNQTGIYNERFTGHMSGSYLDLGGGDITLSGPLTIDFSHAIDYAQKVFGRKTKGLNVSGFIIHDNYLEDVPVIYYDAAGNVVEVPADFDSNYDTINAVRVKVDKTTAGVMRLFVKVQNMYDDPYFFVPEP